MCYPAIVGRSVSTLKPTSALAPDSLVEPGASCYPRLPTHGTTGAQMPLRAATAVRVSGNQLAGDFLMQSGAPDGAPSVGVSEAQPRGGPSRTHLGSSTRCGTGTASAQDAHQAGRVYSARPANPHADYGDDSRRFSDAAA